MRSLSVLPSPNLRYEPLPAFPVSNPSINCSPLLPNSSLPFPAVPPKSSIFNSPASKVKLASASNVLAEPEPVMTLLFALSVSYTHLTLPTIYSV